MGITMTINDRSIKERDESQEGHLKIITRNFMGVIRIT